MVCFAKQAAEKLFGLAGVLATFRIFIDPINVRGDDQKQAAKFSYLT
jgi:hypothetical protein